MATKAQRHKAKLFVKIITNVLNDRKQNGIGFFEFDSSRKVIYNLGTIV